MLRVAPRTQQRRVRGAGRGPFVVIGVTGRAAPSRRRMMRPPRPSSEAVAPSAPVTASTPGSWLRSANTRTDVDCIARDVSRRVRGGHPTGDLLLGFGPVDQLSRMRGLNSLQPPVLASELPVAPPRDMRLGRVPAPGRVPRRRGRRTVRLDRAARELPQSPGRGPGAPRPGRPAGPAAVAGVIADELDRAQEIATSARIVGTAEAGVVLTRGGDALPLPGPPDDRLLAPDSPILAAATPELFAGGPTPASSPPWRARTANGSCGFLRTGLCGPRARRSSPRRAGHHDGGPPPGPGRAGCPRPRPPVGLHPGLAERVGNAPATRRRSCRSSPPGWSR
jgi:hypothetical protein